MVSNSWRAGARKLSHTTESAKNMLEMRVSDDGDGFSRGVDKGRIFEMGYTWGSGSWGLGLYHVRQVLGEMGGSVEVLDTKTTKGAHQDSEQRSRCAWISIRCGWKTSLML